MADIDPLNPTDSSIVSQFPANERASRVAIEANLYSEHLDDVGRHQFAIGNDAVRDAITDWAVGSFFLNTSRTPAILQRTISIDPDVWENVERTDAQIKSDYEGEADTNAFTDVLLTKLNAIQASAEVNYNFGGYINGLQLANNSGDATNDIDIAVGVCAPDNIAVVTQMKLASLITKRIDASWVVGNNQGGFPTGITLTNDTDYHVFLIKRPDTGVVDAGFDTSLTAVNLLSDAGAQYTAYRRIGSVRRETGTNRKFFQTGDRILYDVPINDLTGASPTARTLQTISVPTGLKFLADISYHAFIGSNQREFALLYDPALVDSVPSISLNTMVLRDFSGIDMDHSIKFEVLTNTSRQVAERCSASFNPRNLICFGYTDFRGQS